MSQLRPAREFLIAPDRGEQAMAGLLAKRLTDTNQALPAVLD